METVILGTQKLWKNENKLYEEVTGISISDYAYDLPDGKIAKYPLAERDQSKLLVWKNGSIQDAQFCEPF